MKKIFSILFVLVLVLSLSLVMAVPSLAVGSSVPPAATGPQTLTGFGGGAGAHEFFLQPGSSWKGDLAGIGAGITWSLGIIGIDATGVIGPPDRYIYFNLQDADSGSHFKHVGINFYLDSSGTGGGTLFQCYQQWTGEGISSHGLNPGELTASDFDLRFDFTKAADTDGWTCTPYFRVSGGVWTLFWDGSFTATVGNVNFDAGKLIVGFDGGADGTLTFDNYYIAGPVSEVFVDDDWAGLSDGTAVQFPGDTIYRTIGIDAFDNIQDGIDSVVASTVNVAAGTYAEHIVITKSNLSLIGEDKETTIIDATQNSSWTYPKPGILINGVSGVTVSGFTIRDAAIDENGDPFDPPYGWGPQAKTAILIYASSSNNAVENNILINNYWGVFVCAEGSATTECKNNRIANNIIRDSEQDGVYLYTDGVVAVENTEIINNEMDNLYGTYASGVEFWAWPETAPKNLAITGTVIRGNNITNCTYGFRIRDNVEDITGTLVNFNNFVGNTNYGVYNGVASPIDATNNWWGHASGPSGEDGRVNKKGKVIGRGDSVSDNVDWDPWLRMPVWTNPAGKDLPPR